MVGSTLNVTEMEWKRWSWNVGGNLVGENSRAVGVYFKPYECRVENVQSTAVDYGRTSPPEFWTGRTIHR
jgi:hypothetical protein